MDKVFLLDAYALIYRAYYAFISRPMRNAEGLNTSAVFGFVKFLNELIRREHPHYLGVAFDPKGGNFRKEIYPEYKANREATPEDITASVPYIKEILEAMRIPILEVAGYEADDVIGTLSQKAAKAGYEVYMVTPDKDFGQLVRPTVHIYKQRKGDEGIDIVGCAELETHYGISDPRQVIDILALWGDASDNIPGVPGIGKKTATKLVCEFGSVEKLLANTGQLKGKQRESVEKSADRILLAKQLATIELNVPIEFLPEDLAMETPDLDRLTEVYRRLGFRSFLNELQGGNRFTRAGAGPGSAGVGTGDSHNAAATRSERPSGNTVPTPAEGAAAKSEPQLSAASHTATSFQGDLFAAAPGAGPTRTTAPSEGSVYTALDTVEHTYHTITTDEELDELIAVLTAGKAFCFDTETTGFDVFSDQLVGISFAVIPHEAWYVVCTPQNIPKVIGKLKPLFENEKIAKIGQNLKFDIMVMRAAGIEVKGTFYDTMIIHYLLDPESRHGMDHLSRTYLNYNPIPIEALIGRGARQLSMDRVAVETVSAYSCEDADVTLQLKELLWPALKDAGQADLYLKIEEPLIRVLADIEMAGVKIDTAALAASGQDLMGELTALEQQIHEMTGDPSLNVNSARQLGDALFLKLKIAPNPQKTKTKQFRTDEEYLQSLYDHHPVIALILEYRKLKKLLSTYVDALPQLVNPCTGHIHTSFNQAVTATGRLSSTNPNLQNIPIREERGREIRKAFIPSGQDRLLLSADYSQVELRLMAHLSGDQAMIDAFAAGIDIHTATAARLFGIPQGQVSLEQRRKAKTANFGIIYGISAFGLAQRLNIPRGEARQIIDGYFTAFPGVRTYMEQVIEQARQDGHVTTLFGRKRMLPGIRSGNAVVRGLSERNAINAPIQGGAADIMKIAMISVHSELAEKGLQSKIILQVHDELVIDMLRSEEEAVRELVVRCMESAAKLRVALIADCGTGENWIEAH